MTWDYTKLKIEIVKRNMTETQFREAVGFSTVILSKINKGKKKRYGYFVEDLQFFKL